MRWLANHSTFIFIYYRIALGVLLIVLLATGVLNATEVRCRRCCWSGTG